MVGFLTFILEVVGLNLYVNNSSSFLLYEKDVDRMLLDEGG